jgi:deazaflavin-dependent oxidoreductase (nitroreductase family)
MSKQEEIHDNPTRWVRKHIRSYVETEGRSGHKWNGVRTLLLTTRGRQTGKLRRTALIYGEDKGRYVVVGSRGGHQYDPNWYLNLVENPEVQAQVGAEIFDARAYTAQGEERAKLWSMMAGIWQDYAKYAKKTEREIPVIVLELID